MGGSSLDPQVVTQSSPSASLYPTRAGGEPTGNLLVRRVSPFGTVMVEADITDGILTIWADPIPHPDDWTDLLAVLRAMYGPPIGVPELDGEFDVWTIPVNFELSSCPVTSTVAQLVA